MDSPRTLPLQTAHNPSSSPKSSWILNKTLPLQTVHNPPPQQPEVEMNSTQNPTAANCSQPPQPSNGSSRICYQTPTPQTVHNLASCPRYSRILHQNLPLQAVHNPHIFPESSRIVHHTLPRQAVHNRLKQNLILQAAFNLHRSLKLRQNSISTRLSRQ